jgi:hypothetical protein
MSYKCGMARPITQSISPFPPENLGCRLTNISISVERERISWYCVSSTSGLEVHRSAARNAVRERNPVTVVHRYWAAVYLLISVSAVTNSEAACKSEFSLLYGPAALCGKRTRDANLRTRWEVLNAWQPMSGFRCGDSYHCTSGLVSDATRSGDVLINVASR